MSTTIDLIENLLKFVKKAEQEAHSQIDFRQRPKLKQ
jgi:hypothetical protein